MQNIDVMTFEEMLEKFPECHGEDASSTRRRIFGHLRGNLIIEHCKKLRPEIEAIIEREINNPEHPKTVYAIHSTIYYGNIFFAISHTDAIDNYTRNWPLLWTLEKDFSILSYNKRLENIRENLLTAEEIVRKMVNDSRNMITKFTDVVVQQDAPLLTKSASKVQK
jgi:hypothetical protein